MSTLGDWGRRQVKINNKTYYPYIFCNGTFKRVIGHIFENPRYFITNENLIFKTSDGKYFKVFNNVDIFEEGFLYASDGRYLLDIHGSILSPEEANTAIAGMGIVGQAIVGKGE